MQPRRPQPHVQAVDDAPRRGRSRPPRRVRSSAGRSGSGRRRRRCPRRRRAPTGSSLPAPSRYSASVATSTSLPIRTGTPRSADSVGAERERALPAGDVAGVRDLAGRVVDRARRADARPPAAGRARRRRTPAASRSVSAIATATAGGPPSRGVGVRALPRTAFRPSSTTAWILVPPRSMPPRSRARVVVMPGMLEDAPGRTPGARDDPSGRWTRAPRRRSRARDRSGSGRAVPPRAARRPRRRPRRGRRAGRSGTRSGTRGR